MWKENVDLQFFKWKENVDLQLFKGKEDVIKMKKDVANPNPFNLAHTAERGSKQRRTLKSLSLFLENQILESLNLSEILKE